MSRLLVLVAVAVCAVQAIPQYGPPADQVAPDVVHSPHGAGPDQGFDTSGVPGQGGEYWWKEQDVFANTGNHPATHVDDQHSFTPQQSPLCDVAQDCVPWSTCIDGYIDTTGSGGLDLRGGTKKPPSNLGYTECGAIGNVCCGIPIGHLDQYPTGGAGHVSGGGGSIVGGGHASGGGGSIVGGGGHVSGGGGAIVGGGGHVSGGGGSIVGGGGGGYVEPASGPPYPGCSAGLKCVVEAECNLYTGFIGARIPLYEGQPFIEYQHCTTEYLPVGVCCQDDPLAGIGSGVGDGGIGSVGGGGDYGGVGGVGVGGVGVGGVGVGGVGVGGVGVGGVGVGGVGGGHGVGGVGGGHGNVGVGGVGVGGVGGGHGGVGGINDGGVGGGDYGGAAGGISGGVGSVHTTGGGGVSGGGVSGGGGVVSGGGGGYGGSGSGSFINVCTPNEDCVPLIQCRDGVINNDGATLINVRIKKTDYTSCVGPDYPTESAVCCRIPDAAPPVEVCPDYSICTDRGFCDNNGFIVSDPYSGPVYGDAVDCYTNYAASWNVGVCCNVVQRTPLEYCPGNSVCIPEDFCFGDILDGNDAFLPYAPGGSWAECALPGLSEPGVCCSNPPVDTGPLVQQCGVSHYGSKDDKIKTRIHVPQLNKQEADFGEMPWQAIVFHANYTFKCGASVISDKYLITVAHCVAGLYPQDIRIRVGEWQVNTFTEPLPYQDLDVSNIVIHPAYKPGPHWNNIAIIELKTPIELQYNVNSICLPFNDGGATSSFPPGTYCLVSGWGKDSFEGTYQHILKKIEVPLVDHHTCQNLLRYTRLGKYFRLHDSYMCAGGEEGKDACVGDGGGPLICFDDASKSYVQVGLTAWGIGCGIKDVPGAYTDLSKFTPWISEVTGIGNPAGVGGYGK